MLFVLHKYLPRQTRHCISRVEMMMYLALSASDWLFVEWMEDWRMYTERGLC